MSAIELIDVEKRYGQHEAAVSALKDVSLAVEEGEILVILGPSGSGKSTMLHIVGALDTVTSGMVTIGDQPLTGLKEKRLARVRRDKIGFVFQDYGLLPNLTVAQNIELGARLTKDPVDVDELIVAVGLQAHRDKFPSQMSGGEQQRVAIARALAKKPQVLLCDEPTGSLDEETGKLVLAVLQKVNKDRGTTMVIVTHNPGIAAIANRVVKMNSGRIVTVETNQNVIEAADIRWT